MSKEKAVKLALKKHFNRWSRAYEKFHAPLAYKVFAGPLGRYSSAIKAVVSFLQAEEGDTFLDVATGTGLVFKELTRRLGSNLTVVGVDISLGMLKQARKYAREKNLEKTHLIACDAESLPLRPTVFTKIACSGAFMGFPHPQLVLNEMFRVLKPRGIVSILYLDEDVGYWTQRMVRHADESHQTPVHLFSEEKIRKLMADSGFEDEKVLRLAGLWRVVRAHRR